LKGISTGDINRRVDEVVGRCAVGDVRNKLIGKLSKGYRQRVGLAQAILHDPDVLILDEPTSGLDPNQIGEIRNVIKEFGRTKTVIFSTHILPEVQVTCSRVLAISDGKIVADATPHELARWLDRERGMELVVELSGEIAPGREAIEKVTGVQSVRPQEGQDNRFIVSSSALARCPIAVSRTTPAMETMTAIIAYSVTMEAVQRRARIVTFCLNLASITAP
jgi:ABC-2 type transport system ATP-binding protein